MGIYIQTYRGTILRMKKTLSKKGFTLIELMVVVAIIALLTGIVTVNLTKSRGKARDAKRVSDLGQLQLALELVFDRCNQYPQVNPMIATISTATVCTKNGTQISINTFISTIPVQQSAGSGDTTYYRYGTNIPYAAGSTDYVLATRLENPSEVLTDDVDATTYTVTCTDTAPNYNYCVKPQ
jgi:prepilin-type N-terminal cleavage/methylation domain-containing protein